MSDKSEQAKPDHISQKRWQQHLDWMQVTGETTRKHLQELQKGQLWRDYQKTKAQR